MKNKVLVSGSVCYDYILNYNNNFKEHLSDKSDIISMAFQADNLRKSFGGTAGNICYSMKLLGIDPLMISCVGSDFSEYKNHFTKIGMDFSGIKFFDNESTASVFVVTDNSENQISTYYPGAMKYIDSLKLSEMNLKGVRMGLVSPSTHQSMINFSREMKELNIPYIFDPGQQLPRFSGEELLRIADSAKMLIMNNYEMDLFSKKTGSSVEKIRQKVPLLVVTKGKDGSVIYSRNQIIKIPAAFPRQVIDPTGAGDAYRAGFIKGMLENMSLFECGLMGSIASKYVVEMASAQAHYYSLSEFRKEFERLKRSSTDSCQ